MMDVRALATKKKTQPFLFSFRTPHTKTASFLQALQEEREDAYELGNSKLMVKAF